jgi:hypothetical protein
MDIARTAGGFQRIEDIAVVGPEIVFKKAAGFQTQGIQFADAVNDGGRWISIKSRAVSTRERKVLNTAS